MTHSQAGPARQWQNLPESAGSPNRLLRAAYPLLECIPQLRLSPQAPDLTALHGQLSAQMMQFVSTARQAGLDEETVSRSGYCLCALLDEIIAETPWGNDSWAKRSLLVTFHQETSGGERFFGILQWLSREPQAHLEQLEFMYVLLALGMGGRYRLLEGGHDELGRLRERLYHLLSKERGASETALAPAWRQTVLPGTDRSGSSLLRTAAFALPVLLLTLYLGLDSRLAAQARLALGAPIQVALRVKDDAPEQGATASELARRLAGEIQRHQLMLEVQPDRTILTLRIDSLFASGSAIPRSENMPLLQSIASALAAVPGRIEVTGHSDNRPTAAGAADNRQLSRARAQAVAALLQAGHVAIDRITVDGRGPDEPLVPNSSVANLARNRRVVISVFDAGTGTTP